MYLNRYVSDNNVFFSYVEYKILFKYHNLCLYNYFIHVQNHVHADTRLCQDIVIKEILSQGANTQIG